MKKIKIKKNETKGQVSINTIFYIMMLLFFVAILIYGYSKFFLIKKSLSSEEKVTLLKKIKDSLIICEEPLQKEDFRTIQINSPDTYNIICILGTDLTSQYYINFPELLTLHKNQNNLVFADGKISFSNNNLKIKNLNIIDTERININISKTKCYGERYNKIMLMINCSEIGD